MRYTEDSGTPAVTEPDKNIDHMTKEEYQKYAQAVKEEKELVRWDTLEFQTN